MKQAAKIIASVLIVTTLVGCAYFLGRIHENRRGTLWAFSKIVTDNIWTAKHIRNNNIENALGILELNADFFSRALQQQPTSIFPTKSELHAILNADNSYSQDERLPAKETALRLEEEYALAFPDMTDRLEAIRTRSFQ